ncbi:hypothetical protein BX661DRAFT_186858 [Kickxella alabastrina]|uniref:uncharacterized protein n=1 Tax=Kickxella alabastrina TaxID=61397 RepID=UPI00221EDE17|nr:uncharacterized protein BX661DRAFT_186858 [Kickxella alabastrina]KAI7823120.1 hypothetical protein BX661DRAFT_186858 [Kickxella alabastrina]
MIPFFDLLANGQDIPHPSIYLTFSNKRKLQRNATKIVDTSYAAIALSGIMFIFIFIACLALPAIANRTSLRILALISLFNFLYGIISMFSYNYSLSGCVAQGFFLELFIYSGLYLTSAIAFNLHLKFLRSPSKPLPKYIAYLYFVVPIAVATMQLAPQYIYAATHVALFLFLVKLLIPAIFGIFNFVTSVRVIIVLCQKRCIINGALKSVNRGAPEQHTTSAVSKRVIQLQAVRKVCNASIRVAIYPLVPLVCIGLQDTFTLSSVHGLRHYLDAVYLTSLLVPVTVITYVLVFLFDPVFCQLFTSSKTDQTEQEAQDAAVIEESSESNNSISAAVEKLHESGELGQIKNNEDAQKFFKTI